MQLHWADIAAQAAEQFTTHRRWATPGELAQRLDPRIRPTPALDLIDQQLVQIFDEPDGRLIISMPPQEGKSTRAARDFPIWALTQNRDMRIITASYSQSLANRNGRSIRDLIARNVNLLGLSIAADNGAVHEWSVAGREGGVLSVGVGAGVTGRAADMLIIDDPVKNRKEADSETFRDNIWDWWTDSASTRLAPGAPVVVILTRWHEDDLAGRLKAAEDGHLWKVINIPAQATSLDDPLGRDVGEFMISARDTGRRRRNWNAIRTRVGSRTWNALYQGHPSPAEGGLLKRDWWRRYSEPLALPTGETVTVDGLDEPVPVMRSLDSRAELIQSWDMTFKGETTDRRGKQRDTDYVCGQVWLKLDANVYLVDQIHGRYDFPDTIRQFRRLTAKWPQSTLKIVEDAANGPAVIASLSREIPGIVPEIPQGSKTARVSAVSPVIEAGNVWLPTVDLGPWADDLIEEAAGFPNAAHDDRVDALSQAVHRLLITPLIVGGDSLVDAEDLYDDLNDFMISPA